MGVARVARAASAGRPGRRYRRANASGSSTPARRQRRAYFFHALILPVVIARGRVRLFVVGGVLANVVGLYVVDYLHPGWVIPYQSAFDRVLDNITGYVVCAMALVAILWSVLEAYVAERARLVEANAKLQQSLDGRTLRDCC
jgi:hypothetical protein